jgi:hypothetical protein
MCAPAVALEVGGSYHICTTGKADPTTRVHDFIPSDTGAFRTGRASPDILTNAGSFRGALALVWWNRLC